MMHGRHMRVPRPEDDRPIAPHTIRRVVGTFRPYRGKVSLVGLAIVVTSGLGVINPLLPAAPARSSTRSTSASP